MYYCPTTNILLPNTQPAGVGISRIQIKNKEYGSLVCIYKREVNKFYPIRIYYKLDLRMGCCATGDRKKPCQCKCTKQPCKCL